MKKAVALLIIAIFLPQQICLAGWGTKDLKSTLKSNFPRAYSTAQSAYNYASSNYTAASKIHSAVKSVTGISATNFTSPLNYIGTAKLAAGLTAGVLTNNQQIATQVATANWRNTISSGLSDIKNRAYDKAIWARDKTIFKPGFWDTAEGREHKQFLTSYFIFITGPAGAAEGLLSSAGGLLTAGVARYAPSLAIESGSWALPSLPKIISNTAPYSDDAIGVGSKSGLTANLKSNIFRGGSDVINIGKTGSKMIWGNPWVRVPLALTTAELVANTGYGFIPGLKSPAYNTFADNNGRIGYLMNEIRREEHLLEPGKYKDEVLSDLSEARATTPEEEIVLLQGVKRYFADRNIRTNERVVAYAAEIASLNSQNQNLASDFNDYEKVFTGMAGLSDSLVTPISKGLDNSGVPFAGAFVKTAGSFNPLTGLSIGANAGANPSYSWRGFADFVANPLEAGIGLSRGSIVDGRLDYDPGYRSLGEAAGSLFILRGGGGEALRGAKSAKTQLGSLSFPPAYEKYKTPVTMAVVTLPLAAAAWYEGAQTGNFGAPAGATAVMAMNMFVPSLVRSRFNSAQQLDSSMSSMEIAVKTPEMDNAFSLLGRMAKENGKDIMDYASTDQRTTFFEHYSDLRPDVNTEYLLTPQLLTAKVGQPVILIPKTSLPAYNSNSGDDKLKKKLSGFQDRIKTKLAGNLPKQDLTKSPIIPVEKLYAHQISTLKKMVTEVTGKVRMVVVRGLGSGKTTALLAYILPYKIKTNLERRKVTLILTPNEGVTKDVKTILSGANEIGFNHEEIQKQLGTDFEFPREITDKKLKIESVARIEDSFKQREEFIDKVMNNDVVVVPYELYSSFHHTYLMEKGQVDPVREKVINRIKDSDFIIDEADLPVFFPSTMMSKGRMYVPAGQPEYDYWKDVFGISRQQYDKAKYKKINPNDMALEKMQGESDAEFEFRSLAQGQNLLHKEEQIPRIEDLPVYDSPALQNLAKELRSKHAGIEYTDKEIAEHIVHGTWGHRAYELKTSSSINREYAVRTESVPAEQIGIYGPKKAVNTVKIGGIEGTDIDNFNLHIAPGLQQILEFYYGAKLISRPLKGDHVGTAIDPLEMLGGGIGLTGTVSDTAKPILEKAGFTKFDYGEVKKTDFAAPVINEDLSQTIKQMADSVENNKGDGLDINLTPYNSISRKLTIALRSRGIHPARLVPTELTLEHLKQGIAKLSPKKLKELGVKINGNPTDADVAKVIDLGDQKIFSNLMSPEAAEVIAQIKEQGFPITKVNLKAQLAKVRKIMAERGDLNFTFKEGKYVFIGGQTPEKIAQALLDSLRTKKAPYAIIGTPNRIGRGLNFAPPDYLAKFGTKAVVNLISPEHMTATQIHQGAGRIGGEFRFTRLKDKEGNLHNPEKIVRLLMSKDMMRPMPELEEALKLDNSQEGVKSLKIIDALHNVWEKNERDVIARSGLSSERIDNRVVESEFKEVDIPTTLDKIKEKDARNYLVLKGYTTESIVKKGEAYVKENKLTIKGLRFMQLVKEVEALSDEQYKILDKITELRLLNIDNPVQFAIGLTEKGIVELEDYNKRGLTSVMCLGRISKPFNTDISSEEIKNYQDIINSALEQKLEFIEGLINKNKIKIDDDGAKELILNKLGLLSGSLANIQGISRQISAAYAKNKGTVLQIDRLRLKSAYREFENIMTYQDLENIGSKLNYPVLNDLIPLFIPSVSSAEITRFSAIFDFAKNYKIDLATKNLFELLRLSDDNNKIDFAKFIDKNTRDPYLKIYAQRLALYENALAKQMQYYIQLFSGKTKDVKEYEQSLQEDVDFFRNFNIDPTKDTQLNLVQLRNLSDGKLPDKLLLRIYLGLGLSDEEIENSILDGENDILVSKEKRSEEVSKALADLIRFGKLWGIEKAARELQLEEKYTQDVLYEAIKQYLEITQYSDTVRLDIVNTASELAPLINKETAINAAAIMGIGSLPSPSAMSEPVGQVETKAANDEVAAAAVDGKQ